MAERRSVGVLGDMRCHAEPAQVGDVGGRVIGLVGAERNPKPPAGAVVSIIASAAARSAQPVAWVSFGHRR